MKKIKVSKLVLDLLMDHKKKILYLHPFPNQSVGTPGFVFIIDEISWTWEEKENFFGKKVIKHYIDPEKTRIFFVGGSKKQKGYMIPESVRDFINFKGSDIQDLHQNWLALVELLELSDIKLYLKPKSNTNTK